ncbi:hypothetical protein [Microvirga lenta]|uniref:hypothetical protein n=1 Tax=Microvirga lenta TaxID=2881337 RepID=UPI001CFC6E0A|nr:hypothetical protein [Microvirga lenta]MCB5173685.1 hypothetical protein [Microvirga lenta]
MSFASNARNLSVAHNRFVELIDQVNHAAITGRDSIASAAEVSVLAQQVALASTNFFERLTEVHCDNLAVRETPCENADDFAVWARRVAHERYYAPFPMAAE